MAVFKDFPEANKVFTGFEDQRLPGGGCGDLPVLQTEEGCNISCWQLTEQELFEVQRTGIVWLMVWGQGHPPVCVVGEKPFRRKETIITPTPEEVKHASRHRS